MADDTASTPAEGGGAALVQDTTPPSGGLTASEYRNIADNLRNRVDLFGKTLAAVATLGTTAVGLNRIGDLFPAEGNEGWVWGACIGLLVAGLAAIGVAIRLMLVGRPVIMQPDLERNPELDSREQKSVKPIFDAAAKRFGYESLIGLAERERSLRKAASRTTDPEERARRTDLADEVKTEIEQALASAQVAIVRRRSTKAVHAFVPWCLYFAAGVGLIVFAVGTDKIASDRKDPIAGAKACGEARKAGATAKELEDTDCEGTASTPADASPAP
jgi:hypothetical protein